jgi:hypothetical protein
MDSKTNGWISLDASMNPLVTGIFFWLAIAHDTSMIKILGLMIIDSGFFQISSLYILYICIQGFLGFFQIARSGNRITCGKISSRSWLNEYVQDIFPVEFIKRGYLVNPRCVLRSLLLFLNNKSTRHGRFSSKPQFIPGGYPKLSIEIDACVINQLWIT